MLGAPLGTNLWVANVTHLPAMNGLFFLREQLGCPCASGSRSLSSTLGVSSPHSQPGPSQPAPPASSLQTNVDDAMKVTEGCDLDGGLVWKVQNVPAVV